MTFLCQTNRLRRSLQAALISPHSSTRSLNAPSQPHHDLPSFLAHATRNSLDPTSTLYIGTHYEYTTAASLSRLGLILRRTGGRADHGIDLLGTWRLPRAQNSTRVLVQCKALRRKASPNLIRELEGAFAGLPLEEAAREALPQGELLQDELPIALYGSPTRLAGAMALLATPLSATKGVRDAIGRSRWPIGVLKIALDGTVEQFLWNRAAADCGLQGMGVVSRYGAKDVQNESRMEVSLTWEGEAWDGRSENVVWEQKTVDQEQESAVG